MKKLLIIGAGRHGRVVSEIVQNEEKWDDIAFLDDGITGIYVNDIKVIGKVKDYMKLADKYEYAFVAIGNNEIRMKLINELIKIGYKIPIIIHPKAYVSRSVSIKKGTVVLPGAIINSNTEIGQGSIININATIDHDCKIDEGVHISPGAIVCSMCNIGKLAVIGAGTCVEIGSRIECK